MKSYIETRWKELFPPSPVTSQPCPFAEIIFNRTIEWPDLIENVQYEPMTLPTETIPFLHMKSAEKLE